MRISPLSLLVALDANRGRPNVTKLIHALLVGAVEALAFLYVEQDAREDVLVRQVKATSDSE